MQRQKKSTFPSNDRLEQFRRQSQVERSDNTKVNNNISTTIRVKQDQRRANKKIAEQHAQKTIVERDAARRNRQNNVDASITNNTNQGEIRDGWQAKIDKAFSDYGMFNALGQLTNVSDAWRATPSFGRFMGKDVPMSMVKNHCCQK